MPRLLDTPRLDIVYRATSPGHPNCEKAYTPVYPALPYTDHPAHVASRDTDWGWSTFADVNDMWRRVLDEEAADGKTRDGSGQVVYLDVGEMSGQRPDAHKGNGDCLHWALPGVPSGWIRMLYHVVLDGKMSQSGP